MIKRKTYQQPIVKCVSFRIEKGYTGSCYHTQHETNMSFRLFDDNATNECGHNGLEHFNMGSSNIFH